MKKKMTTNHSHPIPFLLLLVVLACAPLTCAQQSSNKNSTSDPTLQYKLNLNPSMLILIFVLISSFFFMGFFAIYIRQWAGDSDTNRSGSRRNGVRGRSRRLRGLDPSVIKTFPVLEYSVVKGLKFGQKHARMGRLLVRLRR